jgi:adenosylcobinamide-phosphate synthase
VTAWWVAVAALALDALLGEPRRWHPLAAFGAWAAAAERGWNRGGARGRRLRGALAVVVLVAPTAALAGLLAAFPGFGPLVAAGVLYLCLGLRSLGEHARPVADGLAAGDLPAARAAVAGLVSRDTDHLDARGVARAAVETVLENGADAVLATLFWFAVAGPGGALAHRLVNTLDAMWGYRSERFRDFGWAAARLDDALNWIPARLSVASYALLGRSARALRCARRQGARWVSPNAGRVMAAGAGALGVRLGGAVRYGGSEEQRPQLGHGPRPTGDDIRRALTLVRGAAVLWLAVGLAAALLAG